MKTLRNIVVAAGLTLASMLPNSAKAQEVNFGFNAQEIALTNQRDVRARQYTNADLNLGPIKFGYHGLNETNVAENYFGRNTLMVGTQNSPISVAVVTKATQDGFVDTKVGFRVPTLPGTYGWTDATTDFTSGNITNFAGKDLGHATLEVTNGLEIPVIGTPSLYTEIIGLKNVGENTSLFAGAEIFNLNPSSGVYRVGFLKIF